MSEESDEWGTPWWLYEVLDQEFKFKLDVCASDRNKKHSNFLTEKDNALHLKWDAVNFCNPPYSRGMIEQFYIHQIKQRERYGATTVGPVKYDPSTAHGVLAKDEMDEIRILTHRVKFVGATSGANFPVAIMVCRPRLYTRKSGARELYVDYRELIK